MDTVKGHYVEACVVLEEVDRRLQGRCYSPWSVVTPHPVSRERAVEIAEYAPADTLCRIREVT